MAIKKVPTTVSELLAQVTVSTGNIAKHRDAMAQVAAASATQPPSDVNGGEVKQ